MKRDLAWKHRPSQIRWERKLTSGALFHIFFNFEIPSFTVYCVITSCGLVQWCFCLSTVFYFASELLRKAPWISSRLLSLSHRYWGWAETFAKWETEACIPSVGVIYIYTCVYIYILFLSRYTYIHTYQYIYHYFLSTMCDVAFLAQQTANYTPCNHYPRKLQAKPAEAEGSSCPWGSRSVKLLFVTTKAHPQKQAGLLLCCEDWLTNWLTN